jgi:hypothetical protein
MCRIGQRRGPSRSGCPGGPSRLPILVCDPAVGPPIIADATPATEDEDGRGLLLVSALATQWRPLSPAAATLPTAATLSQWPLSPAGDDLADRRDALPGSLTPPAGPGRARPGRARGRRSRPGSRTGVG